MRNDSTKLSVLSILLCLGILLLHKLGNNLYSLPIDFPESLMRSFWPENMNPNTTVIFVCEHGAAKSVLAATYFDKIARELGLDFWAIARGTNPDPAVSPQTIRGLAQDGLEPIESIPQKLTEADMQSARRVISFCELPEEFQQPSIVEYWKDVSPVSENYERARDVIVERVRQLLATLR